MTMFKVWLKVDRRLCISPKLQTNSVLLYTAGFSVESEDQNEDSTLRFQVDTHTYCLSSNTAGAFMLTGCPIKM